MRQRAGLYVFIAGMVLVFFALGLVYAASRGLTGL
jgi:hypothetical protein